MDSKSCLLIIFLQFLLKSCAYSFFKPTWSYDIISINANSSDTNYLNFTIKLERISRGVFGLSGDFDLKVNLDNATLNSKIYRSSSGREDDYILIPQGIENHHMEKVMNSYYKDHIDIAKKCCDNPPVFEKFVPPLEKRSVSCAKCIIPTDKMPTFVPAGRYYMTCNITSDYFTVFSDMVIMVENK